MRATVAALALGLVFGCARDAAALRRIDSFADCAAAGYPVMESYPERCTTPDGRTFERVVEPPPEPGVYCTQDARQCPDGSYVGREPPDCDFAPCPGR